MNVLWQSERTRDGKPRDENAWDTFRENDLPRNLASLTTGIALVGTSFTATIQRRPISRPTRRRDSRKNEPCTTLRICARRTTLRLRKACAPPRRQFGLSLGSLRLVIPTQSRMAPRIY